MRNTYQNRHGTFYIRLLVPQVLLPHVSKPKVVQSLRTKEHRQAYSRSMKVSMAFEQWVADMKNKICIEDDQRELIINLPNGIKIDFDLEKQIDNCFFGGRRNLLDSLQVCDFHSRPACRRGI
jgi:hypothetical protein